MKRNGIFFIFLCLLFFSTSSQAWVELHSHAFMKHGMGALFQGDFFGPLKSKSWKQMLRSNLNAESLEKSNVRIFIAALYAHPILASRPGALWHKGVRSSILAQIDEAKQFVKRNPEWELVTNPKQGRMAYEKGKKLLILSLEGAHSIFNSAKDFKDFIDDGGISMITPTHLINNDYAGSSYMRGLRKTAFTLKPIYFRIRNGIKVNPMGLTQKGRELIRTLIAKKVWIDMTHMSDAAQAEVIPMLEAAGQPLLYTHTALRKYYKAERGISQQQLQEVKRQGGMVGLVASQEMLVDTKVPNWLCPSKCDCQRDQVLRLATHYAEMVNILGQENVALGSDFNGGIPHLPKTRCITHTSLDQKGLVDISQVPELLATMAHKIPGAINSKAQELQFLNLWARLYK